MLLGVHVSKVSKVVKSKKSLSLPNAIIRDLDAYGLNCAQIFTHGPRAMKPNNIDYKDIKETCKNIDLSVHSSYGSVGIWNVTNDNKTSVKSKAIINHIYDQLKSCKAIGAWCLVLHISKHPPEDIVYGMSLIKSFAIKTNVKILLEMVASKSDPILTYETPKKINNLTNLIGSDETWWGWCVDTAHLWGAGVDISSYVFMSAWLNDLKYKSKILMFHLNGSSSVRGSGTDKHEVVFSPVDLIWRDIKPKLSGLCAVIEFINNHPCTIICEINRGSPLNINKGFDIMLSLA